MASNKGRVFTPIPLSEREAAALVDAARTPSAKAIIVMLWRAGLRANELCSLEMDAVQFNEDGTSTVKVNNPKGLERGAPRRTIGLGKRSTDVLLVWVRNRPEGFRRLYGPGPFFMTSKGNPLLTSQIRRTVSLAGKRAGLRRRVHPHCLRHTFASGMYDEGIGVKHIQAALGHAKLKTTDAYLRDIGCDEVVDITRRREW